MPVLILHGIKGYAGIHWQQWLHDELVKKGYQVVMPNLPKANHPDRADWLKAVLKAVSRIDFANLIIVGHSLGVLTALDLIEQAEKPVKALISVSGFSQDYGAELNSYFLKLKEINFKKVNKKIGESSVLFGDDDPYVPQKTLKLLARKLRVKPIIFSKGGHLNSEAGYTTFPKLLKIVERIKSGTSGSF